MQTEKKKESTWTAEKVDWVLQIAQDILSLDAPIKTDESDETTIGAFLVNPEPSAEQLLIEKDEQKRLTEYLDKLLSSDEKDLIYRRFGFYGYPQTLAEIADAQGLTRERIRQKEAKILRRLRYFLSRTDLKR